MKKAIVIHLFAGVLAILEKNSVQIIPARKPAGATSTMPEAM